MFLYRPLLYRHRKGRIQARRVCPGVELEILERSTGGCSEARKEGGNKMSFIKITLSENVEQIINVDNILQLIKGGRKNA